MYYRCAVDSTILVTLSTIAAQQNSPTKKSDAAISQLLDYLSTNPDANVRYYASDLI